MVGGGNIFKGERAEADNIGMTGTMINSVMLRGVLKAGCDADVRVTTAIPVDTVAEPFIRLRAIRHPGHGCIVILAAGNGNPYVTTGYPAAQRALEFRADALLSAKSGTDAVYTSDPRKDPSAQRYSRVSRGSMVKQNVRALDQSAALLARDNGLPIHVFDADAPGAMRRICCGEDVGTLICDCEDVLVPDAVHLES